MIELLRICTAGTVDDGKSTLIGRLLYDCRAVYEDQLQAVQTASRLRGVGPIDFSLFTDGLRAEREQGITIDVAYRYFSTPRRRFILADTPGHEQYTRNMATGASGAELAIVLVDAQHGVRTQSRRHARIASLLGITNFALAVNKMDLVDFDRATFERIREEFAALVPGATVTAIPVSALHGDNVASRSPATPWFAGPTLLDLLETVEIAPRAQARPFRMAVQLVIRAGQGFRGYAGQIASGVIRVGDAVRVWPAQQTARVARIVTWEGDLDQASAPLSVTLVLEEELDVGRGDLIAHGPVDFSTRFDAEVVWLAERALDPGRVYLLKHGARSLPAQADGALALNEIGLLAITTANPIAFDRYRDNPATGSFILIDRTSNDTVGAGMIVAARSSVSGTQPQFRAAERLAHVARQASTDRAAIEAVQQTLAEMFS